MEMKKNTHLPLTALLFGLFLFPCQILGDSFPEELIARAKEFVNLMVKEEFSRAVENFDSVMSKAMPEEKLKEVWQPMLILQGGRDYQVTEDDFDGWKNALSSRPDVEFKFYPKLNHLFIEGEGKSTPAEYSQAGHVAKYVIDDIAAWIKSQI